ncbi:MAG: hypothetical protein Q7T63_14640 [Burkholderiaceae bacterium]|nr:hypothetical protein [Burkholderiaceae bacterium]MDP3137338.1 hypothetical protein [Burkholderiaceae bacterium]
MAKDKAAKERKRALKKKEMRVRSQERIARENKLMETTAECVSNGDISAKALADLINGGNPPRQQTAASNELDRLMTETGIREQINIFCRAALSEDAHGDRFVGAFSGSGFLATTTIDHSQQISLQVMDFPMSSMFVIQSSEPLSRMKQTIEEFDALVGVCLVWSTIAWCEPFAFAVDKHGTQGCWVVNTRGEWYRVDRPADAWIWLAGEIGSDEHFIAGREIDSSDHQALDEILGVARSLVQSADILQTVLSGKPVLEESIAAVRDQSANAIEVAQLQWHNATMSLARALDATTKASKRRAADAEEAGYLRGLQESRTEKDRMSRRIGELETQVAKSRLQTVQNSHHAPEQVSNLGQPLAARLGGLFG